jgi:hypothetical protein
MEENDTDTTLGWKPNTETATRSQHIQTDTRVGRKPNTETAAGC